MGYSNGEYIFIHLLDIGSYKVEYVETGGIGEKSGENDAYSSS